MAYIQATSGDRTVYLTLADVPAAAVAYTDLVVKFKKNGASGFTTKTMSSADWINLSGGLYSIKFSANELDTVGNFTFTVTSLTAQFDNFVYDEFSIEPPPTGPIIPPPAQTCTVYGTIKTISGDGPQQIKVVARPLDFPATYGDNLVTAEAAWTYADSTGYFSLNLVQGSVCVIDIERVGIRGVQITVPAAGSALLIDLMPPIPVDYGL